MSTADHRAIDANDANDASEARAERATAPRRFNLGACAARVATAEAELRELAKQARSVEESAQRRTRERQAAEERALSEATARHAAARTAAAAALEHRLAAIEAERTQRHQRLAALGQRLRQRRETGTPPSARAQVADEAFRAATQRYAAYTQALDHAAKALEAIRTRFDRARVSVPVVTDVPVPQGDPDVVLAKLRTELGQLDRELDAPLRPLTRLRHSAGMILTIMLAVSGAIAGGTAIAWRFHPEQNMVVASVAISAVVLLSLGLILGGTARRHHRILRELAEDTGDLATILAHLQGPGRARLDPQRALAERAEAILADERARQQAEARHAAQADAARAEAKRRLHALAQRLDRRAEATVAAAHAEHQAALERLDSGAVTVAAEAEDPLAEQRAAIRDRAAACVAALNADLDRATAGLRGRFRAWTDPAWSHWDVPAAFPVAVPLAILRQDGGTLLAEAGLGDQATARDATTLELTADLVLPDAALLLTRGHHGQEILQQAMLRLLVGSPLGKVRFAVVDPIGLGSTFARFLRLSDSDGHLVGPKVWTAQVEVERVLADLAAHAEKVIQKYLRDRYATLADYNAAAGDLAEPYQVLVVADFPHGFSDLALERLAALVRNGPRCGIFVWLQTDAGQALPAPLHLDDFQRHGVILEQGPAGWTVPLPPLRDWQCSPEPAPPAELQDRLIDEVGRRTAEAATLALPMAAGLPTREDERWSRDCAASLRIPLGRSGADTVQELELGRGTAQHVLIGGRTGSGKSTLLHALITAGAMWYHPDQLEFHLVDFKKGVEFKLYGTVGLPHARVVAVESDRDFGLSVLRALDRELDRRGRLFRDAGVQDLPGWRAARSDEAMPRSLLVIDEFQEFFVEDDALAREAATLLDRFVRQGRAFGLHVVLGSQSLGGASALARSTIGQIGVRVALQCGEADSQLILSDENTAARLLERPGEAIYNDRSGLPEGNTPFQVFWIDEAEQRQRLAALPRAGRPRPRIFAGDEPAVLTRNPLLMATIEAAPQRPPLLRSWLGEPNALDDPCASVLGAGASGNLLVVGHHREAACGMAAASLCAWSAAHAVGDLRLVVVDAEQADDRASDQLRRCAQALPHGIEQVAPAEVGALVSELAAATADGKRPERPTVLILLGLHRLRDLRMGDAFDFAAERGPGEHLADLLAQGPEAGVHIWAWCDSVASLGRALNRSAQRHLGQRVAFQMSAGDSSDLLDDSSASRLGLHHALYADLASGRRVKFRPYGLQEGTDLDDLLARIATARG